jgi:hypothetical protein
MTFVESAGVIPAESTWVMSKRLKRKRKRKSKRKSSSSQRL